MTQVQTIKTFELLIPAEFFGKLLSETRDAETAGAAKYNYFLEYSDCLPDVTFGDFVRKVKVRTVGSRQVSPPMPEPDNILPEGKTCGSCLHWNRCSALIGCLTGDETTCDFAPIRYREAPPPERGQRRHISRYRGSRRI
jgi:hypothetical protein